MKLVCSLALLALVAGCAPKHVVVTKEVPVEVRVAVAAPCMGVRPDEVVALSDKVDRTRWNELGSDQREALLGAQAAARRAYGEKLTIAAAGCP